MLNDEHVTKQDFCIVEQDLLRPLHTLLASIGKFSTCHTERRKTEIKEKEAALKAEY